MTCWRPSRNGVWYTGQLLKFSSHFSWSLLRLFYTFNLPQLHYIQLMIWKNTHLSIEGLTGQQKSWGRKNLPTKLRDMITARHRSGEDYKKVSAALNFPKSTGASIILKWQKFGTTRTFSRTGHPLKLRNWGRKALVKRGDQELDSISGSRSDCLCGDGTKFQKNDHHCLPPLTWPLGSIHTGCFYKTINCLTNRLGLCSPRYLMAMIR